MKSLALYFYLYLHIVGLQAAFQTNSRTFKRYDGKKILADVASRTNRESQISCAVKCINNLQCSGANFRDDTCDIFEQPENITLTLLDADGSIYIGK